MLKRICCALPLCFIFCFTATAQAELSREEVLKESAEEDALRREKYAGREDILLRPALIADRSERVVSFSAEATGINTNEPVEFFLIGKESGHDYEAIAVSLAAPLDIKEALDYIGMPAGRPVDYEAMAFWPRGERVLITLSSSDTNCPISDLPIEKLIFNQQTKEPMPETGLVFTGSFPLSENGEMTIAAQVNEPHSIASTYNERQSILDVPAQAMQGDVYRLQTLNPAYPLKAGQRLTVRIEPERSTNQPLRVKNIDLYVSSAATNVQQQTLNSLRFKPVTGETVPAIAEDLTLNEWLEQVTELNRAGFDPFVTVYFDDDLRLDMVAAVSRLFGSIETPRGIRIEPPPAGHLHYKAFTTDEKLADRNQRTVQPPELHLSASAENQKADLTIITETWKENRLRPELSFTTLSIKAPADLTDALSQLENKLPVLLIYAGNAVCYGDILPYVQAAQQSHPLIHVFRRDNM